MAYSTITYTVEDGVAIIRLNQATTLNLLNSTVYTELKSALTEAQNNDSVRSLILTGWERSFANGIDPSEVQNATPRYAKEFFKLAEEVNGILENMDIPTIAAVGGLAYGGGCELAFSCDFRVGGSRSTFSFNEIDMGILPGAHGCSRATAIMGHSRAKQMIILSEKIKGEQAYEYGILTWYIEENETLDMAAYNAKQQYLAYKEINESSAESYLITYRNAETIAAKDEYDRIYEQALAIARSINSRPGKTIAAAKRILNQAAYDTLNNTKSNESNELALLFNTADQKEGMKASIEKRAPAFTNN